MSWIWITETGAEGIVTDEFLHNFRMPRVTPDLTIWGYTEVRNGVVYVWCLLGIFQSISHTQLTLWGDDEAD